MESTSQQWILLKRPLTRSFDVFCVLCLKRLSKRQWRDLRRHRAHSDVTVMILHAGFYCSPICKFNFVSAQPRLEFRHGWVIQFHWFTLIKLDIHTQVRINPCYWKEPISTSKASSGGSSPAGLAASNMRSSAGRVLCSYYLPLKPRLQNSLTRSISRQCPAPPLKLTVRFQVRFCWCRTRAQPLTSKKI